MKKMLAAILATTLVVASLVGCGSSKKETTAPAASGETTAAAETGKKTFKSLDIYVKPEENVAYYVVNGRPGSVQL